MTIRTAEVLSNLQRANKFCDFGIIGQDGEIRMHKCIADVCSAKIRQHCDRDADNNTFEIKDFPQEVVRKMVDFFYQGTYDYSDLDMRPAMLEVLMFYLADKYEIDGLKNCVLINLYGYYGIENTSKDFFEFRRAVQLAYITASHSEEHPKFSIEPCEDHGLRLVLANRMRNRMGTSFLESGNREAMQKLAKDEPLFAKDAFLYGCLLGLTTAGF